MQLFPVAHKGMDIYTGNDLEQKYHTTQFSLANRLASVLYINNFVTVHNGVQSVRPGETRGMGKLRADGMLDDCVGLDVHGGCGFIHDDDLRAGTMVMMIVNSTELKANKQERY